MAENQEFDRYRVNSLPTSGLKAGTRYDLSVGGGKYKTAVVSDSLELIIEAGAEFIECDTVAELRALDARQIWAIQNGYYKGVKLNGYYQAGDTPAPIEYLLSTTSEEDDGGSVFEVGSIKLEHEFDNEVDLIYFGVNEDIDDSSIIINKVLILFENSYKTIINTRALNVVSKTNDRFSGCIEVTSGIRFINKGTITLSPTTNNNYAIIGAINKQDFNIEVGNVTGYKGSLLSSGEWGMGVSINQCKNFTISKGVVKDCWGDGIYLSGTIGNNSDNFNIHDIQCYYNRRQGLSIVGAKNGSVYNCAFNYTKGAAPQSGVDIEPNGGQEVRNVTFNNIICEGNETTGFQIYSQLGDVEDITVNNLQCIGNKQEGVLLRHPKNKNIIFNNTTIKDSTMGVECRQGYDDAFFKNIQFFNISDTSIYLRQNSKNVQFNNVFIKDAGRAVSLNTIENVTISDAVVYNSRIDSNSSSNVLLNNIKGVNISNENFINIFSGSYITIKNSDIQGDEDYSMERGVYFSSAGTKRFISVVNVTVTNSNTHGVEFISVDTGDISSCNFYKCRGTALIKLGANSKNVTVQNCIGKTTLLTEDKVFAGIDCSTGLEKLTIKGNDFKNTYSGTAEVSGFSTAIDSTLVREVASNHLGSVRQSLAVSDVTTADATDETTAIALVNELKAKLNAMLASDRTSGQRAT